MKSIARKLNLPEATVEKTLQQLSLQNCVAFEAGRWRFKASERHLSKTSPLIAFHHANWRQRTIENSKYTGHAGTHFTVVQSLSRSEAEKLQLMMVEFIDNYSAIARPSEPEVLYGFNLDFFPI